MGSHPAHFHFVARQEAASALGGKDGPGPGKKTEILPRGSGGGARGSWIHIPGPEVARESKQEISRLDWFSLRDVCVESNVLMRILHVLHTYIAHDICC
jgi:hypothetical protein